MTIRPWITLCETLALTEATQNNFMRGGCFILALWLHAKTKLPLYGLWEGDVMHHAFVYDAATDTAFDARGSHKGLEGIKYYQGLPSKGTEVRPTSVAEVRDHAEMAQQEADMWGRTMPRPRMIPSFVRTVPSLMKLINKDIP